MSASRTGFRYLGAKRTFACLIFVSLHKAQPESMEIGFVICHHSSGEWVIIEDGMHDTCEASRICVVEECHKKFRLSVGHLDPK